MQTAIVTASYSADFERCRLLCETVDELVEGASHHYLLVASHDVRLFKTLEAPGRTVVDERDLLPAWLRAYRDPLSLLRRHVWLSPKVKPLRGWHVQQLRRMAIARHSGEDAFFYCDSDVAFVRPFDLTTLWQTGKLRLYRSDNAITPQTPATHAVWSRNAAAVLAMADRRSSPHDYISTLVSWRRDSAGAMLDRIEQVSGRHWVEAIGASRQFSECMIYGRHADEIEKPSRHFLDGRNLCAVRWTEPLRNADEVSVMLDNLDEHQVAVGIQSFLGAQPDMLRGAIKDWNARRAVRPASPAGAKRRA